MSLYKCPKCPGRTNTSTWNYDEKKQVEKGKKIIEENAW